MESERDVREWVLYFDQKGLVTRDGIYERRLSKTLRLKVTEMR